MPPNAHSINTAARAIHHAVTQPGPDPLVTLTSSRWMLEGASNFWAGLLQIATVVVVLGVVVEVVATILEVRDEFAEGKPAKVHHILTFVGGALVVLAVAAEYWAESKGASIETELRKNNAAAQGVLDKRAREATAEAVQIANKFGGLQNLVTEKEGEMDEVVRNLSSRTNKEINALTATESRLQTAQGDAIASAGRAATAADAASKTAVSMNDTLNSERQMQSQMRAVITHRTLTDDEATALVQLLKPFAKTPFDLFVFDDPDARGLVMRLNGILTDAGWEWRDAPSIGGLELDVPNGKRISLVTLRGISVEIAESSRPKLEKPVLALVNGLNPKGWTLQASSSPDEKIDKKYDHNVVHIFVGARD